MDKKLLIEKIETKIEEFREGGSVYDAVMVEGLLLAIDIINE